LNRVSDSSEQEEFLAAYLEEMEAGQAAVPNEIANSLDDDELASMLYTAQRLRDLDVPSMRPAAVASLEQRLLVQASKRQRERSAGRVEAPWRVVFRLGLAALAMLTVLVAVGGGSVWVVSARNLPGSPLYPVKRASENLQLALTGDIAKQAALHTTFALRRLDEAVKLQQQSSRWDQPTLDAATEELNLARQHVERAGGPERETIWEHIAEAAEEGERELLVAQRVGEAADRTVAQTVEMFHDFHQEAVKEMGQKPGADGTQRDHLTGQPTWLHPIEGTIEKEEPPEKATEEPPESVVPTPVDKGRDEPQGEDKGQRDDLDQQERVRQATPQVGKTEDSTPEGQGVEPEVPEVKETRQAPTAHSANQEGELKTADQPGDEGEKGSEEAASTPESPSEDLRPVPGSDNSAADTMQPDGGPSGDERSDLKPVSGGGGGERSDGKPKSGEDSHRDSGGDKSGGEGKDKEDD
jgi:hypothetical protein